MQTIFVARSLTRPSRLRAFVAPSSGGGDDDGGERLDAFDMTRSATHIVILVDDRRYRQRRPSPSTRFDLIAIPPHAYIQTT